MPSRWLRWFIVLFWLATTSWLFWNDVAPRWRSGEPPSLRPDDTEEVQNGYRLPTFWTVLRQQARDDRPVKVFQASTWIEYDAEEDFFTINAKLDASKDHRLKPVDVSIFKVETITSFYLVNRAGQLLSLQTTVDVRYNPKLSLLSDFFPPQAPAAPNEPSSEQVRLRVWGEVRDRQFFGHCRADVKSLDKPIQLDFPAAEVSYTGSVLMPLHPIRHIRGLRLGQSWRQPLVDPLRGFAGNVRWFNARVLSQPQVLDLDGNEMNCSVIEYTNDDNEPMGHTWVDRETEQVLQQEAILDDGHWIMKRDLPRKSPTRLLDP